jgi:hypothetical protein
VKRQGIRRDARASARITTIQRKRARQSGGPPVARLTRGLSEPAACERCFAIYRDKTWRAAGAGRRVPADVTWTLCPACAQVEAQEYFGRVRVTAALAPGRESEVRRRIWNVERRARVTQPERRLVHLGRTRGGLEVLTTSQKLAHRIARELEKAFGGRASYEWSAREELLEASWDPAGRARDATPRTRRHARR